jgi:outer membrane protein OmpA-like peptidoglycan-associated protein
MTRKTTAGTLACLLASAAFAQAQATATPPPGQVNREDVKTWTATVGDKEWSIRPAALTMEGDTGLFRIPSAYTLGKGQAAFGYFFDNIDRDPRGLDFAIHGLVAAYGITDKLEVFGSLGAQARTKSNYRDEAGYFNDLPFGGDAGQWQTGFGDVRLGLKMKFADDYQGDAIGAAIRGFVKLPTADEAKGLGTGGTDGGFDLVLNKHLNRKADLYGTAGYEFKADAKDPEDRTVGNAFRWGVGLSVPACTRLQFHTEVVGRVYGDTGVVEQTNTADLLIGASAHLMKGLYLRAAWGYALAYDGRIRDASTAKRSGANFSIGYHPGTPCCQIYVEPPPPPPPVNRPPTVSLDCVRDSLLAGETTPCKAIGADPDGDALTYSWSTNAGKVVGTGTDTTFDSATATCGTTATVQVAVSDGRGGQAMATDTVLVRCADKPKPEPVTCTSGGFPRNLSRLNNMDKACLDGVAAKLREDPRGRVVITGHADQSERAPEVMGRKRAEAVKGYLVKERGAEDARVSTRSAGASKPVDTGKTPAARAKNRRVDVTFVPEGATVPELD